MRRREEKEGKPCGHTESAKAGGGSSPSGCQDFPTLHWWDGTVLPRALWLLPTPRPLHFLLIPNVAEFVNSNAPSVDPFLWQTSLLSPSMEGACWWLGHSTGQWGSFRSHVANVFLSWLCLFVHPLTCCVFSVLNYLLILICKRWRPSSPHQFPSTKWLKYLK